MSLPEEIPTRWLEQIRQAFAEELEKELQNRVNARDQLIKELMLLACISQAGIDGISEEALVKTTGLDYLYINPRIVDFQGRGLLSYSIAYTKYGNARLVSICLTKEGMIYLKALKSELGER